MHAEELALKAAAYLNVDVGVSEPVFCSSSSD